MRLLVARARDRVDLGRGSPRFLYGNADEGGFFRPLHEPEQLAALCANLPRLSPVERMGLVDHQWALARAGRAPIESFLELVGGFDREPDPDVLLALRGPLAFLEDRLARAAGSDVPAQLRAWIAHRFEPAFEALGWNPRRGETDTARLRRAALLGIVGEIAQSNPVLQESGRRFEAYLADRRALDPNLADSVVSLAARTGDEQRFDALLSAFERPETPQERRRFLLALADFRRDELVDRTLSLSLSERVPTQDVALLLVRLLGNPAARERTWRFVKRRWKALRRRMPPMLATRLIEATPALGTRAHRREVAAFFRTHPLPTGARALRQALERFDLDEAFARMATGGLRRWLASARRSVV